MLTYDNAPIIRTALMNKLEDPPRTMVYGEPLIRRRRDCIRVGVLLVLDGPGGLQLRSLFDLPLEFELRDVHNQIDEIAEQCKQARRMGRPHPGVAEIELPGTGLRGAWRDSMK